MKVLVVGGAGYIGSMVVRKLIENADEPVVFDNLSTGHEAAVSQAKFVFGDLLDKNSIDDLFSNFSFQSVVYVAGFENGVKSFRDPYSSLIRNLNPLLNLLKSMADFSVRRLVFASTSRVYGKPDGSPVGENSRLNITSPLGEAFYASEKILGWFEVCHQIKSVALRLADVAGASSDGNAGEDRGEDSGVISRVITASLQDGVYRLAGNNYETPDGTCVRDFVHVEDASDAFMCALRYLSVQNPSDVFNVASSRATSTRQIIETVESKVGRKLNVVPLPRRMGDEEVLWLDNSKAKEVLGWEPKKTTDDMVQSSLYWHAKHPNGYSHNNSNNSD